MTHLVNKDIKKETFIDPIDMDTDTTPLSRDQVNEHQNDRGSTEKKAEIHKFPL